MRIILWNGLNIGLETEPNGVRFANSEHERQWTTGYGHIRNHIGEDNMSLDVYVNINTETGLINDSDNIYKITQLNKDGEIDEYKFMIGYADHNEAKSAFLANMPKSFYGGIVQSSLDKIKSYKKEDKSENSLTLPQQFGFECAVTAKYGDDGRRIVTFEVPITELADGRLVLQSIKKKQWDVNSVIAACEVSNNLYAQKIQTLIFESHPTLLIDPLTENQEFSQSTNPPLFEQFNCWVDLTLRKVFFQAYQLLTAISSLYVEAIDLGYDPEISIRAAIACPNAPKGQQFGLCFIPEGNGITLDIMKPGEKPGIPGSKLSRIFEQINNNVAAATGQLSDCGCGCNGTCEQNNINNNGNVAQLIGTESAISDIFDEAKNELITAIKSTYKSNSNSTSNSNLLLNHSNKLKSRGAIISAKKGVSKMNAQKLFDKAKETGASPEYLAYLQGMIDAEDGEMAMAEEVPGEDEMGMEKAGCESDSAGFGADKAAKGDKADKSAKKSSSDMGSESANEARARQKRINDRLIAEDQARVSLETLQSSISRARSANSKWPLPEDKKHFGFESAVDITNIDAFPIPEVNAAVVASVNKFPNLFGAGAWLASELPNMAARKAGAGQQGSESAENKGVNKTTSVVEKKTVNTNTNTTQMGSESMNQHTGHNVEVSESKRYKETDMKLFLKTISSKVPQHIIDKRLPLMLQGFEAMDDHLVKTGAHIKLNRIHDRQMGRQMGSESSVLGLSTDILNREQVMLLIARLAFWMSALADIASPGISSAYTLGRVGTVGSAKTPFCQAVDIKSRIRAQMETYDSAVRELPTDAIKPVEFYDTYDQYMAYFTSSQIDVTSEARMFMALAPLMENIPTTDLFELAESMMLDYTLRGSHNIIMSALQFQPAAHAIVDETVADSNFVRNFATANVCTLKGITTKATSGITALVCPLKGAATASASALGPLIFENKVGFLDRGNYSLTTNDPMVIKLSGVTLRRGKWQAGAIVPLSTAAAHANPQYAYLPSGLFAFNAASGLVANDITLGNLVLHQYSYTTNFITLDFTTSTGETNVEIANREMFKIQLAVSDIVSLRNSKRPNIIWTGNNINNYLAFSQFPQRDGVNAVDFARIAPGFSSESGFDGFSVRNQQYLQSNDPIVRDSTLGVLTMKGLSTSMLMGSPEIVKDFIIGKVDDSGYVYPTNQEATVMRQLEFHNTIAVKDNDGNEMEYPAVLLFCPIPPSTNMLSV